MSFIGDLERFFAASLYPNRVLVGIVAIGVVVALVVLARRRRWDRAVRRHPRASSVALLAVVAVAAPLGWYLGSPLFLSTTVDEPSPIAVAATAGPSAPQPTPPTSSPAATASPVPAATRTASPVRIERSGSFRGADDFHFGEGTARLIETSPGTFTVRLEDFAVRNGPDLFVYLSPAPDGYVDGAIELGRLKADRGNQNYDVPGGIDIGEMASVVIWCKQFAVLFATATLDAGTG